MVVGWFVPKIRRLAFASSASTATASRWSSWDAFSARLDRDRDGLLVFFVGVVLFRFAAAANLLADLLVAAAPVVMLASGMTISRMASNTSRRVVGQWGGARGAICEDHCCLTVSYEGRGGRCTKSKPVLRHRRATTKERLYR